MPSIAGKKYPAVIAAQQGTQTILPVPQHHVVEQETSNSAKQKTKTVEGWKLNGKNHEYLFGSSNKGQANLQPLRSVTVRHHQSDKTTSGRKIFKYAPLCSIHACNELCPHGINCPNSHQRRSHFTYSKKDGQLSGPEARAKVDKVFADASK